VGLFKRSGDTRVTVAPEVITPRQTVQAAVTTDKPIDKVSSATLEWGYTNFYRYQWAGRVDSAAAAANDSIWTMDQVGTNYGGERDTDDWVSVTKVEFPVPSPGSHARKQRRNDERSNDQARKGIPLRNGTPVTVPFAVPLPEDAPPTAETVHSSLMWFLEATLMYSKWTEGVEKVRRQIVVVNAP
jgi:hypothetical protein